MNEYDLEKFERRFKNLEAKIELMTVHVIKLSDIIRELNNTIQAQRLTSHESTE